LEIGVSPAKPESIPIGSGDLTYPLRAAPLTGSFEQQIEAKQIEKMFC
jgi:hypothetical protein